MNENTFIPEHVLYKVLKGGLMAVREDHAQTKPEEEKFLYRLFNNVSLEKNQLYEQATDLFLRENTHDRFVDVRMYFDSQRAKIPTIHINLENETEGDGYIGVGIGTNHNLKGENQEFYENEDGTYTPIHERRYNASFNLICTSDNHSEVLIMYHYLRSLIASIHSSFALVGFENLKTAGLSLQINEQLVPEHIFSRGLTLNFSYINRSPLLFNKEGLCDTLNFNLNYYINDGKC